MKTRQEIQDMVVRVVAEKLNISESEVSPSSHFANDLGADSLDLVELIMELEKEFNITIPDTASQQITTVEEAISYIEEHLA